MLLSVVTINFNNKSGLIKTVNSILNQNNKDFEWVFVDGNSTDGSYEYVKELIDNSFFKCKVRMISESDKGIYDAMNKGIHLSAGKYVLFLNSGDFLYGKQTLGEISKQLNFGYDLVCGSIRYESTFRRVLNLQNISFQSLKEKGFLHPATIIKKELFDKIGIYNDQFRICGDLEWFYRLLLDGELNIYFTKKTITVYNLDGISYKNYQVRMKEREQIFAKNEIGYYAQVKEDKGLLLRFLMHLWNRISGIYYYFSDRFYFHFIYKG